MMLLLYRSKFQRGNFVISASIATLVMAFAMLGYAVNSVNQLKEVNGRVMGSQLQIVLDSLTRYIAANAVRLDAPDLDVPNVNNKFEPSIAELRNLGFLNDDFPEAPTFGGAFVVRVQREDAACVAGTGCSMIGTVHYQQVITMERGTFDLGLLQAASNVSIGQNIGYSLPATPGVINGPSWTHPNPLGNVAGTLLGKTRVNAVGASLSLCPSYNETTLIDCTSRTQLMGNAGVRNTAIGINALASNLIGSRNSALGSDALRSNEIGTFNIGIGDAALASNVDGNHNVALGNSALGANTSGASNIAIGTEAQSIGSGAAMVGNVSIGERSLRTNASGRWNVAIGMNAMLQNSSGNSNVAIGYSGFQSNTSGSNNIALGTGALHYNATGGGNIGLGQSVLFNNRDGNRNVALGQEAMHSNSIGVDNIALGHRALYGNTNGQGNVAIGPFTSAASGGSHNVAIGYYALTSSTTSSNVAIGYEALRGNTVGDTNVAIGYRALLVNSSGSGNVAIGHLAGSNTNSSNSTSIGAASAASGLRSTALGYGAQSIENDTIVLGNSQLVRIRSNVTGITSLSDGRLKTNISGESRGLDFIRKLKPVNYEFLSSPGVHRSGFIAQDVYKADSSFSGVSAPALGVDYFALNYTEFIAPIVKSIQELDGKIGFVEGKSNSDFHILWLYAGLCVLFLWNCFLQFKMHFFCCSKL